MSTATVLSSVEPAVVARGAIGGYRFDLSCPICAGELVHVASGTGSVLETRAVAMCEACWKHWSVEVRLTEVTNELGRPVGVRGHGSISSYQRGCKCRECMDANATYKREYRARRRATGPIGPEPPSPAEVGPATPRPAPAKRPGRKRSEVDLAGGDLGEVAQAIQALEDSGDVEEWKALAACRGLGNEAFYVESGNHVEPARTVCTGCPVRLACLAYALSHKDKHGIWGGTTDRERRRLLKALNGLPAAGAATPSSTKGTSR